MDKIQTDLARFLAEQGKTYRELEELTGIPDSTISKIINGKLKGLPELETLVKISVAFNLPLWRVVEMTGLDSGVSIAPDDQAKRVAALVKTYPVMNQIVDRLTKLHQSDLRGVLAYLEAILNSQYHEPN